MSDDWGLRSSLAFDAAIALEKDRQCHLLRLDFLYGFDTVAGGLEGCVLKHVKDDPPSGKTWWKRPIDELRWKSAHRRKLQQRVEAWGERMCRLREPSL